MSKASGSTRQTLASHSVAKVSVFTYYLGTYLNIMGMAGKQKVHIYDLMCGEGQYADGQYGSALTGLRRALAYFSEFPHHTLRVAYTLNDDGPSDVEPGRRKIERVRERAEKLPFDTAAVAGRMQLTYTADTYETAIEKAIVQTQRLSRQEKALLFIDPWGYKVINIADLRAALAGGHSEVLLFLPAEMMYRFVRKVAKEDFAGGEALKRWLTELFPAEQPDFVDIHDFINQFRVALQAQVGAAYSSRFTLETADHNTYSLFYFTSSRRGLIAMLDAQWKHDQDTGSGHKAEQSLKLFPPGTGTYYPAHLERHLAGAAARTNDELLEFGLREGFLPKHTNEVLRALAAQNRLHVAALDGGAVRKNAFYLDSKPPRRVAISLLNQT